MPLGHPEAPKSETGDKWASKIWEAGVPRLGRIILVGVRWRGREEQLLDLAIPSTKCRDSQDGENDKVRGDPETVGLTQGLPTFFGHRFLLPLAMHFGSVNEKFDVHIVLHFNFSSRSPSCRKK